jgi:YbbR domain-containing protein
MRLPSVRLRRAAPPPSPPADGEGRPLRTSWRTGVPYRRRLGEIVRHNWGLKLVSAFLACFLWYSINELERDAERVVDLPVAIRKVPPGLIVTELSPAKGVTVTLRGPRTILDSVDGEKTRLVVDLSNATEGKVSIDPNQATMNPELPRRLKAVRMAPIRLDAKLERLAKRRLPVKASLAGDATLGYTAESTATPDHVEVTGPASTVDALKEINTRRIDIEGLSTPLERTVLLEPGGDFVTLVPDRVRVAVRFDERIVSQEFKHVPIALRNGAGAKVAPAEVGVSIRGPEPVLHDWKLPEGAVFVDAGGLTPGVHDVPVQVDLPAPLVVTGRKPETVRVTVPGPKEQGGA